MRSLNGPRLKMAHYHFSLPVPLARIEPLGTPVCRWSQGMYSISLPRRSKYEFGENLAACPSEVSLSFNLPSDLRLLYKYGWFIWNFWHLTIYLSRCNSMWFLSFFSCPLYKWGNIRWVICSMLVWSRSLNTCEILSPLVPLYVSLAFDYGMSELGDSMSQFGSPFCKLISMELSECSFQSQPTKPGIVCHCFSEEGSR